MLQVPAASQSRNLANTQTNSRFGTAELRLIVEVDEEVMTADLLPEGT